MAGEGTSSAFSGYGKARKCLIPNDFSCTSPAAVFTDRCCGPLEDRLPTRTGQAVQVHLHRSPAFFNPLGGCAFVYLLTNDGGGRAAFPAIARPNREGVTGTGSTMSSGTL